MRSKARFGIALASALAAACVCWPVLRQGLWEDEATAVFIASAPTLRELLHRQALIDYSPPLFNGLLAIWGRVFGFGEIAVKVLAFLLGSLAAGAVSLAAAEMFGIVAGAVAGVLAVSNPVLIGMSTDVRPYSLSAFLSALLFFFVFRALRRGRSGISKPADFVSVAAVAVLAAAAHYAGTIVVAAVGLFALLASLRRPDRPIWARIAAASAVGGIFFLPWLPIAWRQAHVGLPWATHPRHQSELNIAFFKAISLLPASPALAGNRVVVGLALACAALLASGRAVREELHGVGVAIVCLAGAAAAVFFTVGSTGPVTRYVTVPAALCAILAGGVLGTLIRAARRTGRLEAALAMGGVALLAFSALRIAALARISFSAAGRAGISKSGVRDMCRDGSFRHGDLVVAAPDSLGPTLWYYAPAGIALRGFVHWDHPEFADFSDYRSLWPDPGIVPHELEKIDDALRRGGLGRVALISGLGATNNPLPFFTRDEELRAALRRKYSLRESRDYRGSSEGARLEVFEAGGVIPSGVSVSGPVR